MQLIDIFEPKDQAAREAVASDAELTPSASALLTLAILLSGLGVAFLLRSVLVVWSILGSMVSFLVAVILPAAFWLRIEGPQAPALQRLAVCLTIISFGALSAVCLVLTAMRLDQLSCPGTLALE